MIQVALNAARGGLQFIFGHQNQKMTLLKLVTH